MTSKYGEQPGEFPELTNSARKRLQADKAIDVEADDRNEQSKRRYDREQTWMPIAIGVFLVAAVIGLAYAGFQLYAALAS